MEQFTDLQIPCWMEIPKVVFPSNVMPPYGKPKDGACVPGLFICDSLLQSCFFGSCAISHHLYRTFSTNKCMVYLNTYRRYMCVHNIIVSCIVYLIKSCYIYIPHLMTYQTIIKQRFSPLPFHVQQAFPGFRMPKNWRTNQQAFHGDLRNTHHDHVKEG